MYAKHTTKLYTGSLWHFERVISYSGILPNLKKSKKKKKAFSLLDLLIAHDVSLMMHQGKHLVLHLIQHIGTKYCYNIGTLVPHTPYVLYYIALYNIQHITYNVQHT